MPACRCKARRYGFCGAATAGPTRPIGNISSFGEDARGELYICDIKDGEIYRISASQAALTLSEMGIADAAFRFGFAAAAGQSYVVEARELLSGGQWQTLTNVTQSASSTNIVITDSLGASQRYYRVRVP